MPAPNEKGPAEGATSPSRGSNNPQEGNVVNGEKDSTAAAKRNSAEFDAESFVNDVYRLAHITAELLDDLLTPTKGEMLPGGGPYRRFTFNDDQTSDVLFMAGETQYRARLMKEAFYASVGGGSN